MRELLGVKDVSGEGRNRDWLLSELRLNQPLTWRSTLKVAPSGAPAQETSAAHIRIKRFPVSGRAVVL